MKKVILAFAALALVGCESQRYGVPCVGAFDKKRTDVDYGVSGRNVVLGVIFSAALVIPAVVILTELECPVSPPKLAEPQKL